MWFLISRHLFRGACGTVFDVAIARSTCKNHLKKFFFAAAFQQFCRNVICYFRRAFGASSGWAWVVVEWRGEVKIAKFFQRKLGIVCSRTHRTTETKKNIKPVLNNTRKHLQHEVLAAVFDQYSATDDDLRRKEISYRRFKSFRALMAWCGVF